MVEKSHTASGTESDWWPALYDPLRRMVKRIADFFAPDADAAATEDKYVINVELPGVAAEDVEVAVHDHVLTLKGEKKSEHEETGKSYFFSERRYGSFQRSFRLPPDVAEDEISAEFSNGVLTLSAPKHAATEPQPRRISVEQK